jgi:hypothetical protein
MQKLTHTSTPIRTMNPFQHGECSSPKMVPKPIWMSVTMSAF